MKVSLDLGEGITGPPKTYQQSTTVHLRRYSPGCLDIGFCQFFVVDSNSYQHLKKCDLD